MRAIKCVGILIWSQATDNLNVIYYYLSYYQNHMNESQKKTQTYVIVQYIWYFAETFNSNSWMQSIVKHWINFKKKYLHPSKK